MNRIPAAVGAAVVVFIFKGDAPTVLVHDRCGTELEQVLRCPACDVAVTPTHIRSRHPA